MIAAIAALLAVYSGNCSATPPGWKTNQLQFGDEFSANTIQVEADGSARWNGAGINERQLRRMLVEAARMQNPAPVVILQPVPNAPCSAVIRLRKTIDRALDCSTSGRCGEGNRILPPHH
jgi:hypothetical protein